MTLSVFMLKGSFFELNPFKVINIGWVEELYLLFYLGSIQYGFQFKLKVSFSCGRSVRKSFQY